MCSECKCGELNVFTHGSFSCSAFQVKEETLFEALTTRKTVTVGEKLIVPYKLAEVRTRQAQAFPLYLFTLSISSSVLSGDRKFHT